MSQEKYSVMYCRVSSKEQEEKGLSLDAQFDLLSNYADEKGLVVIKKWKVSESAKAEGRKNFNEMLAYCKENEIKHILVENYDRLTRNKPDEVKIEKFIKDGGVIHRVGEGIVRSEDTDIEDEFMDDIKFSYSRHERKKISKRVKYAVRQMLKKGVPVGLPLGYKWKGRNKKKGGEREILLTDDADKVEKFLQIFHDKKYSLSQMLKVAKDIGLKSVNGKAFVRREDVARIIRNPFYYGQFLYDGTQKNLHGIYDIKVIGYKPLITKKMWNENQEILKSRMRYKKPETKLSFRFNDLVFCLKCGHLFYGFDSVHKMKWQKKDGTWTEKEYRSKDVQYRHGKGSFFTIDGVNKVRNELVDPGNMTLNKDVTYEGKVIHKKETPVKKEKCDIPQIWQKSINEEIEEELGYIKFNKEAWNDLKGRLFKMEEKEFLDFEIQQLRQELTKNETKKDKLYSDYEAEVITGDFVRKKMEEIENRQTEVRERLKELEEQRENYDSKIGKAIEILDKLKDFQKIWKEASEEKKTEILKLIMIKIFVVHKKLNIKGKETIITNLEFVYNDEFNELFDLGLVEKSKEVDTPKIGGGGSFNLIANRHARSDIEDLAFPIRSSREPGESGLRVCIEQCSMLTVMSSEEHKTSRL